MSQGIASLPMMKNWRRMLRRLLFLLGIGIGGSLLYTLLTTDRESLNQLLYFRPGYLLLAMLLAVLPWLGHTIRLWIWSRFLKYKLSLRDLGRIAVATDLGSAVTPTAVGGAPIKIGMLMQKGYSAAAAAWMVALASLEDILFFICFVPTLLLLTGKWELLFSAGIQEQLMAHRFLFLWLAIGLLLLILSASFFLRRYSMLRWPFFRHSKKRQSWLWRFRRSLREFRQLFRQIGREGKLPFLFSMGALVFQWLCRLSVLAALMLALGLEVKLLEIWLLQWLLFISMLFVPTPGATGGAEAAFILIFGALLPQKLIGLLAAGWRLLTYYFILLLALLLLYLTRSRSRLSLAK